MKKSNHHNSFIIFLLHCFSLLPIIHSVAPIPEGANLYEVLGLDNYKEVTLSDLNEAKRKQSKKYHPDQAFKRGNDPKIYHHMTQRINGACNILENYEKKLLYDRVVMEKACDHQMKAYQQEEWNKSHPYQAWETSQEAKKWQNMTAADRWKLFTSYSKQKAMSFGIKYGKLMTDSQRFEDDNRYNLFLKLYELEDSSYFITSWKDFEGDLNAGFIKVFYLHYWVNQPIPMGQHAGKTVFYCALEEQRINMITLMLKSHIIFGVNQYPSESKMPIELLLAIPLATWKHYCPSNEDLDVWRQEIINAFLQRVPSQAQVDYLKSKEPKAATIWANSLQNNHERLNLQKKFQELAQRNQYVDENGASYPQHLCEWENGKNWVYYFFAKREFLNQEFNPIAERLLKANIVKKYIEPVPNQGRLKDQNLLYQALKKGYVDLWYFLFSMISSELLVDPNIFPLEGPTTIELIDKVDTSQLHGIGLLVSGQPEFIKEALFKSVLILGLNSQEKIHFLAYLDQHQDVKESIMKTFTDTYLSLDENRYDVLSHKTLLLSYYDIGEYQSIIDMLNSIEIETNLEIINHSSIIAGQQYKKTIFYLALEDKRVDLISTLLEREELNVNLYPENHPSPIDLLRRISKKDWESYKSDRKGFSYEAWKEEVFTAFEEHAGNQDSDDQDSEPFYHSNPQETFSSSQEQKESDFAKSDLKDRFSPDQKNPFDDHSKAAPTSKVEYVLFFAICALLLVVGYIVKKIVKRQENSIKKPLAGN